MKQEPIAPAARGLRTNARELVMISVAGEVAAPLERGTPWRIGYDGRPRSLPAPSFTVADLIRDLAFEGKRIAVEKNGEIVPRSRYAEVALAEGEDASRVVIADLRQLAGAGEQRAGGGVHESEPAPERPG